MLLGLFNRFRFQKRGDVDPHAARTDDRFEQRGDLAHEIALDLLLAFELHATGTRVGRVSGLVEVAPGAVENHDGLGTKLFDTCGDEAGDALDRRGRQRAVVLQLEDHRRLGRFLFGDEEGVLGHGNVHARTRNFRERGNRASQLALERPAVVDVLEKLRGAERGAVEDLEPNPAGRRQAGGAD